MGAASRIWSRHLPLLLVFVVCAGLAVACETPDASNTTSPSARALLGLTTGNVSYSPIDMPPAQKDAPSGWQIDLGNARFTELENGTPALMVVMQLQAQAGAGMELWLSSDSSAVAEWFGGTTNFYDGTVCFQMRLVNGSEALTLDNGPYYFTLVFRDPDGILLAKKVEVTHFPPLKKPATPSPGSSVFRDLLGCPRGS